MRRYGFFNLLAAITAASIMLVMVFGLFAPEGNLAALAALLLQTVVVVLAIAILIGLFNLLGVHYGRIRRLERGWLYSLLVLLTYLMVIMLRILNPTTSDTGEEVRFTVFEVLQTTLQSALAGLIFFFLVYAAYRLLAERITWNGFLFVAVLLIVLLGWVPLAELEVFHDLRQWLMEVPVTAGSRGILIGVSIATVTAGLRVLVGQERAYRE